MIFKEKNKHYRSRPIEFMPNENECWICISHTRDKAGYPVLMRNQKNYRMSRYVYEQTFGEIPEGLVIMHLCDNPNCINPNHLKAGTTQENTADMVTKERHARGTKNGGGVKLNEDKVRQIRNSDKSLMKLAKEYNVSKKLILLVKQNKIWRHVE